MIPVLFGPCVCHVPRPHATAGVEHREDWTHVLGKQDDLHGVNETPPRTQQCAGPSQKDSQNLQQVHQVDWSLEIVVALWVEHMEFPRYSHHHHLAARCFVWPATRVSSCKNSSRLPLNNFFSKREFCHYIPNRLFLSLPPQILPTPPGEDAEQLCRGPQEIDMSIPRWWGCRIQSK